MIIQYTDNTQYNTLTERLAFYRSAHILSTKCKRLGGETLGAEAGLDSLSVP